MKVRMQVANCNLLGRISGEPWEEDVDLSETTTNLYGGCFYLLEARRKSGGPRLSILKVTLLDGGDSDEHH